MKVFPLSAAETRLTETSGSYPLVNCGNSVFSFTAPSMNKLSNMLLYGKMPSTMFLSFVFGAFSTVSTVFRYANVYRQALRSFCFLY